MGAINKVVIAGATGNLGPAILEQLLAANFASVTVFTRPGGKHTFPAGATVVEVDYTSIPALTTALQGQDAVISTLGEPAKQAQLNLIDAAAQAGVQRYVPSEFGVNTLNDKTAALPLFAGGKVAVRKVLEAKAASTPLSYSLVITGPFLDWGLQVGFILNAKGRAATLYDGGERVFSATTLADIGRAVVGVLRNPEETKNRAVYVQSAAPTLKQLAAAAKKASGAPEAWTETVVQVDDVLADAYAELQKPDSNPGVWAVKFIHVGIFGDGYGAHFDKLDNDLLGVKELSSAELEALVARFV